MTPFKFFIGCTILLVSFGCLTGEVIIKPLSKIVHEQNQLIADCESKLARDEFCEIVAIPKVKK